MSSAGGVPPPDTSGVPDYPTGSGTGSDTGSAGGTPSTIPKVYQDPVYSGGRDYDSVPSPDSYNTPPAVQVPVRAPPMAVPWTYPATKTNLLPPIQVVDTGSEVLNYGEAIWASWCNFLTVIPNMQNATREGVGDAIMSTAREYNADQDIRNAGNILPVMHLETAAIMAPEAIAAAMTYATQAFKSFAFIGVGSGPFTPLYLAYPAGRTRPVGPVELIPEAEYEAAKWQKVAANQQLREQHANFFDTTWADIHEPHPIRFGGHPTDMANKEILHPPDHWEVTAWWNALQRWIEGR